MKSKAKLWQICMEIYRKQYKEATPSADFDKLIKSGKTKKEGWFLKYYLPQERQDEIMDAICKNHKLDKYDKHRVSVEIHLGSSPKGRLKVK